MIEIVDDGTGVDRKSATVCSIHSSRQNGKASALGLVNTKSVVERHRGTIQLQPGLNGVGTRVIIELPVVTKMPTRQADSNERRKFMAEIMVVDDDEHICSAFQHFLTEDGHTPIIRQQWRSSHLKVREIHPDLVLMDIRMPGTDGLERWRKSDNSTRTPTSSS